MRLNRYTSYQAIWLAGFATFFVSATLAADLTWTGAVSSDWNDPTNWSPQQVPAATDHVIINSGSVTVPANGGFATLDWAGGNISGVLLVASNSVLNWSGGVADGSLTIASTGVLNLGGSSTKSLYNALTNAGTVNWAGSGNLIVRNTTCVGVYGLIENLAGALWDIQGDQQIYNDYGCGIMAAYFHNAGTLRKSAATGTTTISIPFNNAGTVQANAGTLTFASSGVIDGVFNAAAGAAITFSGSYTGGAAPVLNGPGAFQFTGGTLTLPSDVIPNLQMQAGLLVLGPGFQGGTITNLTLDTMTLISDATVGGVLNWNGGTISGSLTVASTGVLNLGGSSTKSLYNALTNAGTVNWAGSGNLIVRNTTCVGVYGLIENLAGALWDIQGDQQIYNDYGCGIMAAYFHNAGTLRKSAATGTTTISIPFNNAGTVQANAGTLTFASSGVIDGVFNAAAGAAITFSGSYTGGAAPVLNGPGAFQFTGGTLTLPSDVIPNLQMQAGLLVLGPGFQGGTITNLTLDTMTLISDATVGGVLNWNGGTISGSLTVASTGVLNLGGSSTKSLYNALTNAGTVNWAGSGNLIVRNTTCVGVYGLIENLAGALWDIQGDQQIYNDYGCGIMAAYFHNAGTLRKSAATGTTTISIPFNNAGTVQANAGTLTFASSGVIDGVFNAAAGAAITFSGSYTGGAAPVLNGPGAFQFTGGTLTLPSDVIPNLQMQAGLLVLGPGFQGGTITNLTLDTMTLISDATVGGVLNWNGGTISGSLTVASTGVLNLGGSSTKSLYNALTNAGTVNWAGSGNLIVRNTTCVGVYGLIENLAGALWDIQGDQQIYNDYGCGIMAAYFHNAGTLRKSAATGTTTISIPFNNAGTVQANAGTLTFASSGVIDGVFNAAAGAAITFSGSYTGGAAPVLNGPGAFQFTGGTLTLPSDVIPNLQMQAGLLVLGPGFQGGTITNLTLDTMTLISDATVGGVLNWNGGTISGSLTVASTGVLNLGGSSTKSLYNALTNAGTVNWAGSGNLIVRNTTCVGVYGLIENLAGALWDIQGDQQIYNDYGCGIMAAYFHNAGTLRKSAATGTTTISIPFNNAGTVQANAGTLTFASSGVIDGVFNAAAGAAITFSGSYTGGAAPVLNGPGAFQFTGGTLTLPSDVIPNLQMQAGLLVLGPGFQGGTITNLTLDTMTLISDATVGGVLNWNGGTISGSLTVASTGVLNLGGSSTKSLYNALTNAGTVNWAGSGNLIVRNTTCVGVYGLIENLAGALWDIQGDQQIYNDYGCGIMAAYFHNAGTLRKSAATGTTTISIPFNNAGTVQANAGTLTFASSGVIDGVFNAAAGAAITFSGSYTGGAAPVLNGPGAFQFTGGTLTLPSDVIPNLQMQAGLLVLGPGFQGGTITNLTLDTMTLISDATVGGVLNWNGGTISGSLTVASTGVLNLGGSSTKSLYNALTNAGTVNWAGSGNLIVRNTTCVGVYGLIENLAGALWDIQGDQQIYNDYGCGIMAAYFHNAGTLRKSAATGTTTISIPFNNAGTVQANAGTLALNAGFTPGSGELLFGLNSLSNYGKISIAGNATLDGTVGVAWLGGYVPATNDSFTVLYYGSYSGLFTGLDLPTAALWATNYGATSFTITVASIDKLAFTTGPAGGRMPGAVLAPVIVQVEHPIGDPVATNGVPVTLSLDSGSGTLSGTLTRNTDPTGKATFSDLSIDQIGKKTLRASSPVQTPATSALFKIVPLVEVEWTSGGVMLGLNGTNSYGPTTIYATTNLQNWTPIYTNPPTTSNIQYFDTDATNYPYRFYRAVEQ